MVDERFTEYLSSTPTEELRRETGKEVKQFILDDIDKEGGALFEARFSFRVGEPLFKLVRPADGTEPQAAQLYYRLNVVVNDMEEAVRTQPELAAVRIGLSRSCRFWSTS